MLLSTIEMSNLHQKQGKHSQYLVRILTLTINKSEILFCLVAESYCITPGRP